MRPSLLTLAGAVAGFAATGSSALAQGVETVSYTFALTNPTATAWSAVLFEIEPDEDALANDASYAALFEQVIFPQIEGTGGQSLMGKPATVSFDDPSFDDDDREVVFQFAPNDPLTAADGFVLFNLTIETPDANDLPFEVRVQPVFVPTPGTAALLGFGLLAMTRRRPA